MAGFDGTDPALDLKFGYRSDSLRSGIVSYNGFVFPPALSSKVTVVPEYDETGTTIKYQTWAFQIEFIVTDATIEPHAIGTVSSTGMNNFMVDLRKRLTQPCQKLTFTEQGFGNIEVNGSALIDVDYGPKPQVIEWEPLGGHNAARVEWLCTTRIPPCGYSTGQMVQFSYTNSWGIDPSGFMLRTIEGSAEFPNRRAPSGGTEAANSIGSLRSEASFLRAYILARFPNIPNVKRQWFFRVGKDKKRIDFKIEDLEYRTDNIVFPGVSDIDISQSVSSNLDDNGFTTWDIVFSGRLEVMRGNKNQGSVNKSKAFAWIYIGKLLQQKRQEFENTIANNYANLTTGERQALEEFFGNADWYDQIASSLNTTGDQREEAKYQYRPFIYPTHFSVIDSLYSNSFSFTVGYRGIILSSLLAQGVGLFQPISLSGATGSNQVKYLSTYGVQNGKHDPFYGRNTEPIVDLCHPVGGESASSTYQSNTNSENHSKIGNPILETSSISEQRGWIEFKNEFQFTSDTGTVIGKALYDPTQGELITTDVITPVEKDQIAIPKQKMEYAIGTPEVEIYTPSTYKMYVIMKGRASRYGGKVTPPRLLGVGDGVKYDVNSGTVSIEPGKGGAIAHKLGDHVRYNKERTGLTTPEGEPVFKSTTTWTVIYVLDRIPTTTTEIRTTGTPGKMSK